MTTVESGTPERRPAASSVVVALIRQLRVKQWVKNVTCFAGLIFSGRLGDPESTTDATLAFVAFCLAASSVYIVNDYTDRERDRLNPRTANRPLASGDLPVWLAALTLAVFSAAAGSIAWGLGGICLGLLVAYAAMNLLYSWALKHMLIVDVMCIAMGFVLRVLFGVYAIHVLPTAWIVLCMFTLALFLGFSKRRAELGRADVDPAHARPVLQKYRKEYLDILVCITATLAIICYALFTVLSHRNPTLVITVIPVIYCVCRYLHHVIVAGVGQSPEEILLGDRFMVGGVLTWVALCVVVLYGDLRVFTASVHG
ncbi:MAG: decaprenyl-phosphate phosphoribosyltransferase [Fimbriiglobus sp.]